MTKNGKGWKKEPARHSLAARGYRTKFAKRKPAESYTSQELHNIFKMDIQNMSGKRYPQQVGEVWVFMYDDFVVIVKASLVGDVFRETKKKDGVEVAVVPVVLSRGDTNEWTWLEVSFDHDKKFTEYDVLVNGKYVHMTPGDFRKYVINPGDGIVSGKIMKMESDDFQDFDAEGMR